MATAPAIRRAVREVLLGVAFRADARVGDALLDKAGSHKITRDRIRQVDMAFRGHGFAAERRYELRCHVFADLEAF